MSFYGPILLLLAFVFGAQWGGAASIAGSDIIASSGFIVFSLFGSIVGGLILGKVLASMGRPIKSARNTGFTVGIALTSGLVLFSLHQRGVGYEPMIMGAGAVGLIVALIVAYEASQEIRQKRVAERVGQMLEKGLKESYNNNYQAAEETFREAIHAAELGLGSIDNRTVRAVRHLADMYRAQKASHRCRRLYRRCVDDFEAMLDPPIADYAGALFGLAQMYKEQRDLAGSLYYCRRALEVLSYEAGHTMLQVRVLRLMASIHSEQDNLEEALACGDQACEALRAAGLETQSATLAANLIDFLLRLQRFEEAEQRVQELLQTRQRLKMGEDGVLGQILMAQAQLAQRRGEDPNPMKLQALDVLRRSGGPDYPIFPKTFDECVAIITAGAPPAISEFFGGLKSGMTNKSVRAVSSNPDMVNAVDGSGWRPLQWACFFGNELLVTALLEREASIQTPDGESSPLHIASRWGHTKIMNELLDLNAPLNSIDGNGCTPLHCAACSPANRAVDLLVSRGADVTAVNSEGYTALHLAAQTGRTKMVVDLIARQAEIDSVNPNTGETPLHLSVKMGHRGASHVLLMQGADKNRKDKSGNSSFSLAKASGRDDLVTLMKEN